MFAVFVRMGIKEVKFSFKKLFIPLKGEASQERRV